MRYYETDGIFFSEKAVIAVAMSDFVGANLEVDENSALVDVCDHFDTFVLELVLADVPVFALDICPHRDISEGVKLDVQDTDKVLFIHMGAFDVA